MQALGILPEELLKISPEKLVDPSVTEEVYQLRVSHYN